MFAERFYGQPAPVNVRLSIRQPGAAVNRSDPIRQRSLIVCPFTFGPRFATVVMYPLELPLHAIRPAIGLLAVPSISPV